MLIRVPSGSFTSAGSVMWVGELKYYGDSANIKISVACDKESDGKDKTVFFTAWGKEAEYIHALGLEKFDRVHIDGRHKRNEKNGKAYESDEIEVLLVQPCVSALRQEGEGDVGGSDEDDGEVVAAW